MASLCNGPISRVQIASITDILLKDLFLLAGHTMPGFSSLWKRTLSRVDISIDFYGQGPDMRHRQGGGTPSSEAAACPRPPVDGGGGMGHPILMLKARSPAGP